MFRHAPVKKLRLINVGKRLVRCLWQDTTPKLVGAPIVRGAVVERSKRTTFDASASHRVRMLVSISGLKMKQSASNGALRFFHFWAVVKNGNGPDPRPRRCVKHDWWRRTFFSAKYSLQDTHIDECFTDVSISVLSDALFLPVPEPSRFLQNVAESCACIILYKSVQVRNRRGWPDQDGQSGALGGLSREPRGAGA